MTPIERAARALCELAGNPPGATMNGKPLWQDYVPEVRVVAAAFREPSDDQLIEAQRAMFEATQSAPPSNAIAIGYAAMIDKMLEEG